MKNKWFLQRFERKSASECARITMNSQQIGQRLRARRKFLQLRQRDLAELAGVTLRGLTEIENGRGNPTLHFLMKLADVLGLEFTLTERSPHASS